MPVSDEKVRIIALALAGEFLEDVRKTRRTGIEHGFSICKSKKGIEIGERCVGNKCSVDIGKCRQAKHIGSFHTHPRQPNRDVVPSPEDVLVSWGTGEDFFCISNKKAITRCWKVMQAKVRTDSRLKPTFRKFAKAYLDGEKDTAMSMLLADDHFEENKIIHQIIRFNARVVEREMQEI